MKTRIIFVLTLSLMTIVGCQTSQQASNSDEPVATLMTLDPGHFHAALIQKQEFPQINSNVYVYAPKGSDVEDHLDRIDGFNTRDENPTNWNTKTYTGDDYLEQMLTEKPGNVVVVSGNNAKKTDYIKSAIDAGLNVLADKPMVISPDKFPTLMEAFETAQEQDLLLYDVMTERYEITTLLQKELSQIPSVFGTLQMGSMDNPAITKESVHHFSKLVAGNPIKRPAWFFDETQRGEALTDVSTHLVDLIQWECFPEQIIDYKTDITMLQARRWPTTLTPKQFAQVTRQNNIPRYLRKNLNRRTLRVFSNGEMIYRIKDVYAKVKIAWNFEAPEGTGDTHFSIMRGTKCNLVIRQGEEENYKPTLYIEALAGENIESDVMRAVRTTLQSRYPGLALEYLSPGRWSVSIPERYKIGHEAHFAQVTQKYLDFLANGTMPAWEVPNMIAKYYTTTEALKLALSSEAD